MTWRRHLRMVRATLALWALAIITLATRARSWLERHLGRGTRIPAGVHMLVGPAPDDATGAAPHDVLIDLTERDHATAGSPGR
jgi:hypothetical protein